jgi:cell wall-associated NlpC family hydrolase
LVWYAWKAAGKDIQARNTRMYPGRTRAISASELQPGDILWRNGHVGMFSGNGKFIHAKGTAYGIREDPFRASAWTKFYRPQ